MDKTDKMASLNVEKYWKEGNQQKFFMHYHNFKQENLLHARVWSISIFSFFPDNEPVIPNTPPKEIIKSDLIFFMHLSIFYVG